MPEAKSCMPKVKAMILLDNEGKRVTVKYYAKDWATSVKEQSNFERSLFAKTARTNARGEGKRGRKKRNTQTLRLTRLATE